MDEGGAPPEEGTAEATPAEATAEATPAEGASEAAPSEAPPSEEKSEGGVEARGEGEEVAQRPSRVRMQEEGKPEEEGRERGSQQRPTASFSQRGSSKRSINEDGKEGILRRTSDRASKSKAAVGSVVSIRKGSAYGEYGGTSKAPRYSNSYKLDSDNPFNVEKVEKIMKDVITEALDNLSYDPKECPKQAKWASSAIRARIKEQEFERYKVVVMVTIGEKHYHDMACVIRFLWDLDRDRYAMFVHDNMSVFATALCFGIYFE